MDESDLDVDMDYEHQIGMIRKNRGDTSPILPRVELILVELDLKIKVPPEFVNFNIAQESESSNAIDETANEITIDLTTVEMLLKQHSAKDSQAIQNVRYRDLETYQWEDFPEKLTLSLEQQISTCMVERQDGTEADQISRPQTEESKQPIEYFWNKESSSKKGSNCILIPITVEGFKQYGSIDEINFVRQQSRAQLDRKQSQMKLMKGATLSRIQSVQSGQSLTSLSAFNTGANLNMLTKNQSMFSSNGTTGVDNYLSGSSLQSQQNKTSSFGQNTAIRSNHMILNKHLSMQDSRVNASRLHNFQEVLSTSMHQRDSANFTPVYEESNSTNKFSMHRDSFGKRNKFSNSSSQQSNIHEEAKINGQLSQLSVINESVHSSDHPSVFTQGRVLKTNSSSSVAVSQNKQRNFQTTPQASSFSGSELKINVFDTTFNFDPKKISSNNKEDPIIIKKNLHPQNSLPLQFPQMNFDFNFLKEEEQRKPAKLPVSLKQEDDDQIEKLTREMTEQSKSPAPFSEVIEHKNNQIQRNLSTNSNFQMMHSLTMPKRLPLFMNRQTSEYSGMVNTDFLDKVQRVTSVMDEEVKEQSPYIQYLQNRVDQLEQKNYMLEQNMIFMFQQLKSVFPDKFNQQPPFPILTQNIGNQEPLLPVDEETSVQDSITNGNGQGNTNVINSPSIIPPSQDGMSYSNSRPQLFSQNSINSQFFGTNSSATVKEQNIQLYQQKSLFSLPTDRYLDRQRSNYSGPSLLTNKSPQMMSAYSKCDELKDISQTATQGNSSAEKRPVKLPEIVFAYADIMVQEKHGDLLPLNDNQSLKPDLMYDQIMKKVRESGLKLTVKKTPLNQSNLLQLLTQRIKILFILCHGQINAKKDQENSWFCLEDENDPSKLDRFSEKRLSELLLEKTIQCESIVLSTCHSQRLADILQKHGAKAIIAIDSNEKVLEKAAQQFNKTFLENFLQGQNALEAFKTGISNVRAMKEEDTAICCCFHDHKPGCNWEKFKEKYKEERACELHTVNCLCYDPIKHGANITVITHTAVCKFYVRFVEHLRKIDYEAFVENSDKDGFVQAIPNNDKNPNQLFQMCCCSSEVAHNESQKIIYKGNLETIIFDKGVFGDFQSNKIQDGEPTEQKPDLSKIHLPEDYRPDYHGRKYERSEIVRFLLDKNLRLLHLYGAASIGKLGAVIKSVRFTAERNNQFFKDGAYIIDLEGCNTVTKIMKKIADIIQFYLNDPSQSDIISWFKKEGQQSKFYLLVIKNSEQIKEQQVFDEFKKFIKDILQNTYSLKIICISLAKDSLTTTSAMPDNWAKLEFCKLNKKQLSEYLKQLLKAQRKQKYIANIDLEQHRLFQLDHIDISFLPAIAHDIGKNMSLDQIATQLETELQQLQAKQNIDQKQKIDEELAYQSFVCQRFLDSSRSKQMVSLIFFLIQAPDGLCQLEIKHLSQLRPTLFTQEFMQQFNLAITSDLQDENDMEILEQDENTDEDIQTNIKKFLAQFITIQQITELSEKKFKIQQTQRKALMFLLKLAEMDKSMLEKYGDLNFYDSLSIEFFSRYAVKLFNKITKKKRNGEVDHTVVSMHLQQGMWSWEELDDEEEEILEFNREPIEMPIERFSNLESNFNNILDAQRLIKYFDLSKGNDYAFEKECIINMTLAVPSILIELDRIDDAIKLIEQCSKIGLGIGQKSWMHGKLDLMRASLMINRKKDIVSKFNEIYELLKNAKQIFEDKKMKEGVAEAFYLQGLLLKNLEPLQVVQISYNFHSKFLLHSQSQNFGDNFDFNNFNDNENSATNQGNRRKFSDFQCSCHQHEEPQKLESHLDVSIDSKGETPKPEDSTDLCKSSNALYCMHQAVQFYSQDQYQDDERGHFGLGKSQLMYIDIQLKEGLCKQNYKIFFEKHEEKMQEILESANQQFQMIKNKKYIAYYKLLKAKLYHQLGKLEFAKTLIDEAQTETQDKIRDNFLVSDIATTKNKIVEDIRKNYFNLMTFAMSVPLVREDESNGKITPIDDVIISTYDLRKNLSRYLEDTGKQFQVNYDILSENLLRSVAQAGTRVLHLSSDIIDEEYLCVERENGVAKMLSIMQIYEILEPHTQLTGKLSMDLVSIAIPKSRKIGEVFSRLGVSHVLTFDLELPNDQIQDKFKQNQLDPYRFNYIYIFCISFYYGLATEKTVNEAFDYALNNMEVQVVQLEHILLDNVYKQSAIKISDLGIKPVLLDASDKRHNNKLYDSNQKENPSMILKQGHIIDTSKQRGQLVGMKKPQTSYIGQQKEMHDVIKWLQDQDDPLALIHVTGKKLVGKTRFIQEVAYHLHRHNKFKFKVSYIDLATIQGRNGFKELLNNLDADCAACSASYDDSASSKSEEDRLLPSKQVRDQSNQANNLKKPELLWVFDNAQALSENYWSQFETRLAKKCQNECVRVIISSANNKQKRYFDSFNKIIGGHIQMNPKNFQKKKMQELILRPLEPIQAINLLLISCQKEITKEELGIPSNNQISIRLRNEPNIEKLKNLPYYIIEFAKKLNDNDFHDLDVIVREKDKIQKKKQDSMIQIKLKNPKGKIKLNQNQAEKDKKQREKKNSRPKLKTESSPFKTESVKKTQSNQNDTQRLSQKKDNKISDSGQSPVEIQVPILDSSQHSFNLPIEDVSPKMRKEPSLQRKYSQQSNNGQEGKQMRVTNFDKQQVIVEISSSEYESLESQSRKLSFNHQAPLRDIKDIIKESPENLITKKQKQNKARDDEFKAASQKKQILEAYSEVRSRLFSGTDADYRNDLIQLENNSCTGSSQQILESQYSQENDSVVITNAKIVKQLSYMDSETILVPKHQKVVSAFIQPALKRSMPSNNALDKALEKNEEEKKLGAIKQDFIKSEIARKEINDFDINMLLDENSTFESEEFFTLQASKAQSQIDFKRMLSFQDLKTEMQNTESYSRFKTEDLSLLLPDNLTETDEIKKKQVQKSKTSLKQNKNTSPKKFQKQSSNVSAEAGQKQTKGSTSKSGKKKNQFAKQTKNQLRKIVASKKRMNMATEPQDNETVIEQSSDEEQSNSSDNEKNAKDRKKGDSKPKKYNKHSEEQKHFQQSKRSNE